MKEKERKERKRENKNKVKVKEAYIHVYDRLRVILLKLDRRIQRTNPLPRTFREQFLINNFFRRYCVLRYA